jgi:hypothetical protein
MCNAYTILVLKHEGKWLSGRKKFIIGTLCHLSLGPLNQCIHSFGFKTQRELTIWASRWEGKIMDHKVVWRKTVDSIYLAEDWYDLMNMVMDL